MQLRLPDRWRALHAILLLAAAALFAIQVGRLLATPTPRLELTGAALLPVTFADPGCRASSLVEADDIHDKWSYHPDPEPHLGRCVSEPMTLGTQGQLLVRYAGNPGDPAVHVGLDLNDDRTIDLPLALGLAARHGWLLRALPLPAEALGRPVRLVIDDQSERAQGFVRIRALIQTDGDTRGLGSLTPWSRTAAVLVVMLAALAVLWLGVKGNCLSALAVLMALLSVELVQLSAYFHADEYALLAAYADGIQVNELAVFWDQFMPLFLGVYAGLVTLVGDWYAPLQVLMLIGHGLVTWALVRLLLRQGAGRLLSWSVALLFATAWVHVDVVPWFMESSFLASTGFTLIALERTTHYTQGHAGALVPAAIAAALAPLAFAGGVLAPCLCLVLVALAPRRPRLGLVTFAVTAVVMGLFVVGAAPALNSVMSASTGASFAQMLVYVLQGAFQSSLASLLALRDHAWLAAVLLAPFLVLTAWRERRRFLESLILRRIAFGLTYLLLAYTLQALTRANTGFGEADSLRYTYFGMTGAACFVTAIIQPASAAWLAARPTVRGTWAWVLVLLTVLAVGANTRAFITRTDSHEREHFEVSRQLYAVARAAAAAADTGAVTLDPWLIPKTLFPGARPPSIAQTRRYEAAVRFLAGRDQTRTTPIDPAGAAVWNALLAR
jgi:hypothetical protein